MNLADLCVRAGFCASNKEAKRMIKQGAIKVNNIPVTENLKVGRIEDRLYLYCESNIVHHSCLKGFNDV